MRDAAGSLQDEKYLTVQAPDAQGRLLWLRDARDTLVVQHIVPPGRSPGEAADPAGGYALGRDDLTVGAAVPAYSMDAGRLAVERRRRLLICWPGT